MFLAMNIGDDILDLRDLWKRYQELQEEIAEVGDELDEVKSAGAQVADALCYDDALDFYALRDLFAEVGEPDRWGEFDQPSLIRDSYFETYARDYAEDMGRITDDARWPYDCIDWERAARELQSDFSSIEIGEYTYWRS